MQRNLQLALKLNARLPDPAQHWREGTTLTFLGRPLSLVLSMTHQEAALAGDQLHLPLPPLASPQQIRDRAETWLREQALFHFTDRIGELFQRNSAQARGNPPGLKLSFAAKSPWVGIEGDDTLRCNWRLIEQAAPVIDQALIHALASLPRLAPELDLFG